MMTWTAHQYDSGGVAVPRWLHPIRRLWFEIYLSWRFIRSNFPPTVLVALTFAVSAWHTIHATLWHLPAALVGSFLYSWLFIYAHELPNQILGAEEDAVNKPHRPIPVGLCAPRDAQRRALPVALLYLGISAGMGAVAWAALWLVTIVVYHYGHGHRWWPTKALQVMVGAIVVMGGAWVAGAGCLSAVGWTWLGAGFVYWVGVCALQDQRDIAGDMLVGRRTLPIVIGDRANRCVGAVFLAVLPLTLLIPMALWARQSIQVIVFETAYTGACWHLTWRLLRFRSRFADDLTYKLYAALFCCLAAGPLFM